MSDKILTDAPATVAENSAPPEKKTRFTDMQELAIRTRDKTLLVSAAAGSGKTATLTERIIRSITDEENPVDITEMLIVTFTRLAAGELRERIGKAIKKELTKRPGDAHLEKQLHLLPSARISTIDSFCSDILRANCDRVGISPSFRIPDEAECALLSESLLNGIFTEIYSGRLRDVASPEELASLAECLTDTGTESDLAAVIGAIHHSTVSTLEGADSLLPLVEEYDPEGFTRVELTRFGGYIMDRLAELVGHYRSVLSKAKREIEDTLDPKYSKLVDMLDADLELVKRLERADGYNEARDVLRTAAFKKGERNTDPLLPPTTMIHSSLKSEVMGLYKKFFLHPESEWREAYRGLYRETGTLFRIVKHFDEALRAEKLRRSICEFHDVERYTYECLWQNGEKTDIAIAQSKLYAQIYIDEYQDVNNLQDKIFEAISTPTNRFMVGDIKQSIYRFRSANPDIFARMKKTYPDIAFASDSPEATIFMSDNFRCDRGIIDFTNIIFHRVFGLIGESIGYSVDDDLKCSKYSMDPDSEPPYRAPEICLIDSSALKAKNADDPAFEDAMLTPTVVAAKIRELIENETKNDGKPIAPGDIAIIMRTAKNRAANYKRALEKIGIPAAVAEDTRFFLTPEALLTLCLLNSIDNPHRDIYLAGLMLSPLYSFTEDELVFIRRAGGESLYDSLRKFVSDNPSFEKGARFLESLSHYRLLSEGMPTDGLLIRLYNETGLLALAAKNGTRDRLDRLYEYARSFEAGSFKGLYNFISYLNNIIERKNSLDKRESPKDPNAVNIITCHGSKGLEYPVVFYVGCEESITGGGGAAPRFEYAEGFGIGMYLRAPSGVALVKNATKNIISDYAERLEIEESTRILYVTLTRARERLYVVANAGKKITDFDKEIAYAREYLDPYLLLRQRSLLRLMLATGAIGYVSPEGFLKTVPSEVSLDDDMSTFVVNFPDQAEGENGEKLDTGAEKSFVAPTNERAGEMKVPSLYTEGELYRTLGKRFNFKYPRPELTELPEKMSVSVLYPELLDGTDEGVTMLDGGEVETDEARLRFSGLGILPDFMTGVERDSATKRGIATHLLFQFCNLDRLANEGAEAELRHLVNEHYISERDALRVRIDEVEAFRSSRLLYEMQTAAKLYREFRFNVKLPAEMFATTDEARELYRGESILVQGVIDCLYLDSEGEYHLIDYKTDRLTKKELADPELARAKMTEVHGRQLAYYSEAVRLIFGKEPATREVYSLHLGDTLSVK